MAKTDKKTPRISAANCPENMTLFQWQCALRAQAARMEHLIVTPPSRLHDYFRVSNPRTRHSYDVTFRGVGSEWNYCSCPDFHTSELGTCKHLEAVSLADHGKYANQKYPLPEYSSVYVDYRDRRKIKIRFGSYMQDSLRSLAASLFDDNGVLTSEALKTGDIDGFIARATGLDENFRWYDDALQLVAAERDKNYRETLLETKYRNSDLNGLVKANLYPYQIDGVKFAFVNGRTIIADDMGLGKTIQAIAATQLLHREGFVSSVLIVCPTSLKYQWHSEIKRFTGENALIIEGNLLQRAQQLEEYDSFYKICSYNALMNNIKANMIPHTDMIVFDEVQRLKNWNTQIAASMRRIPSAYVLALSGTPLENKLMELYSVMQLVDQYKLGPFYKFNAETTIVDDCGKVVGYKNLHAVSGRLRDVLIRRLKKDVALQMPSRTDTNMFVPMTPEQMSIHDEYQATVSNIVTKWRKMKFLSEADSRRLLLSLSMMRMVCDSTYILDQSTRYDTKIDVTLDLLADKLDAGFEKVVIFSQWERMLRILSHELDKRNIRYSFLHGGVPSSRRGDLIGQFTNNPECRVFLSTDAGGTGLNLQAASLLINLDLPWNPAVLEQRIARIYRLKQTMPVQIINLVARGTIEERMLSTLSFKSRMSAGILDSGEDQVMAGQKAITTIIEVMETPLEDAGLGNTVESVTQSEPEHKADESEIRRELQNEEQETDMPKPSAKAEAAPDSDHPRDYRDLISQGLSALGGIASALKSPDTTQQLVDAITSTDETTGQTTLNIPVPDKQTVINLLSAFGSLLNR